MAQVAYLSCCRLLMCTGVARKFIGKGVVGVYGDMTNSRKERGAGMCHSLVTAQGGDMWLQQQLVPLLGYQAGALYREVSVPGGTATLSSRTPWQS